MATARAARELLAPPEEIWKFLAQPHHLADWWPGVGGVEPDRRGVAEGARWGVRRLESTLFRTAQAADTLLVTAADPGRRFAFELVQARLRAELTLAPSGSTRTQADLVVDRPFLFGFSRSLPRTALTRLHDLCQTAAPL